MTFGAAVNPLTDGREHPIHGVANDCTPLQLCVTQLMHPVHAVFACVSQAQAGKLKRITRAFTIPGHYFPEEHVTNGSLTQTLLRWTRKCVCVCVCGGGNHLNLRVARQTLMTVLYVKCLEFPVAHSPWVDPWTSPFSYLIMWNKDRTRCRRSLHDGDKKTFSSSNIVIITTDGWIY